MAAGSVDDGATLSRLLTLADMESALRDLERQEQAVEQQLDDLLADRSTIDARVAMLVMLLCVLGGRSWRVMRVAIGAC
jgi:lipase chaperone LimK